MSCGANKTDPKHLNRSTYVVVELKLIELTGTSESSDSESESSSESSELSLSVSDSSSSSSSSSSSLSSASELSSTKKQHHHHHCYLTQRVPACLHTICFNINYKHTCIICAYWMYKNQTAIVSVDLFNEDNNFF